MNRVFQMILFRTGGNHDDGWTEIPIENALWITYRSLHTRIAIKQRISFENFDHRMS